MEGELLLLSVDGAEHPLEKYRPFRFSGDAAASGALPTGDIRDLNVITRNGVFKGYTSIIELSKKRAHPVFERPAGDPAAGPGGGRARHSGASTADVEPSGSAAGAAGTPAEPTTLARYDAVVGSDTDTPEILGRGFLAVVSIDPVAD